LSTQRFGTVVIGAGQAGLAAGYYLARAGADFVIVDAGQRVGDTWRSRWDSLRLFTPPSFNHLPGMLLHPRDGSTHTKDDMADYLETYAQYFELPIQLGVRVDELTRDGGHCLIRAGTAQLAARNVIVATGPYNTPWVPMFAGELDPAVVQLHSAAYRNPAQLRRGAVLVVGAGNSGAEIALELAGRHPTWLAGRDTGHVPVAFGGIAYRAMRSLSVHAWPGKALAAMGSGRGHPLIRVTPADLAGAAVWRVPRVTGVSQGQPVLEDGRVLHVENVVWCTGFVPSYEWIRLPVRGADGRPRQHRGVVTAVPGLYFVGLAFQSSLASHLVGGVAADARYVTSLITGRAAGSVTSGDHGSPIFGEPARTGDINAHN
jgi:putative flavoprotein involved in K+ transport